MFFSALYFIQFSVKVDHEFSRQQQNNNIFIGNILQWKWKSINPLCMQICVNTIFLVSDLKNDLQIFILKK